MLLLCSKSNLVARKSFTKNTANFKIISAFIQLIIRIFAACNLPVVYYYMF
jgi:hypothetical protein